MKQHRKVKIFFQILKNSFLWKAFCGYLIIFFVSAFIILRTEPSISNYGDALWYTFVSCTTIGFGDFAAASLRGRLITVVIYLYTVLILALITAVFTQFFFEIAKAKRDKSVVELQHDLEHLPELPKERLEEISRQIKAITDQWN